MLRYLISEGFRNVFKNKKSTVASLVIMCATMFIFGIFFAIGENVNHMIEDIERQQGMQVFIKNDDTITQEQKTKLGFLFASSCKSFVTNSISIVLSGSLFSGVKSNFE